MKNIIKPPITQIRNLTLEFKDLDLKTSFVLSGLPANIIDLHESGYLMNPMQTDEATS